MTLSISQWRERLSQRFPGVQAVDDSVLRFTRGLANRPFGIYYVDVSDHLPDSPAELTSYQDRVIGKRYFDGNKSLQWSNYLFFVVNERSSSEPQAATRRFIEQDRSYARKYIVTADELESAIEPPTIASDQASPAISILSVWTKRLADAGLETAILSDDPLPKRLALIEKSTLPAKGKPKPVVLPSAAVQLPRLRSVSFQRFRALPKRRNFDFGAVNLIVGANGTGKTSLLEAIELLYCGRTNRNPQADEKYDIAAGFADGTSERAKDSRTQQSFRERNLAWYGQSDIRTWNVYLSFAQFNFLNTDAAARLSESVGSLEEDLSKLLVGPQASRAWKEIERMSDAVAGKLRELRPVQAQMKAEIAVLDLRIKSTQGVTQESDSVFTRLKEMLGRAGWPLPEMAKDAAPSYVIEPFTELEASLQQAMAVERVGSPVTLDALRAFSDNAAIVIPKVDADIARLDVMQSEGQRLAGDGRRLATATRLIAEADRILSARLPSRMAELQTQRKLVAEQGSALAGIDDLSLQRLKAIPPATSAVEYRNLAVANAVRAERDRSTARTEQASFTALRNRSSALAQQLRDIAAQLLEKSTSQDTCPLCHSNFEPGQLQSHIHRDVDSAVEARAQLLITRTRAAEQHFLDATSASATAAAIADYCARSRISESGTVGSIVASIEAASRSFGESKRRVDSLEKELAELTAQGMPTKRVDEVRNELIAAGYPLTSWSIDELAALRTKIDAHSAISATAIEAQRRAAESVQQAIATVFQLVSPNVAPLKAALSTLKEQRTLVVSLLENIRKLLAPFPWDGMRPLTELRLAVQSLRTVAAELQAALARERQAKTLGDDSTKRKAEVEKQSAELVAALSQFEKAHDVLSALTSEHSLSGAMSEALQRNRTSIESIFGRIHSPAEFSGLGKSLTTLMRKTGGVEAELSQISTGQRAAFALSIFLAQNAQLKTAPPVLLIDDPIAHIDDLNSLSFLDFLRDLSAAGQRQIFFATANDKLATLFERKFDFLGPEGFRRYDLDR